jgi:hypothetical protein
VQLLGLSPLQGGLDHAGLYPLVRLAKLGRVADPVEVAHGAPGAPEALPGLVDGLHQALPGGHGLLFEGRQRLGELVEQLRHGGLHVLGADAIEEGELGPLEEGVCHARLQALRLWSVYLGRDCCRGTRGWWLWSLARAASGH